MNKVVLSGRTTNDIELTTTASGSTRIRFSIAINNGKVDDEGNKVASFFNCIAFNRLAELIYKNVGKGEKITVLGTLNQRRYLDAKGNKKEAVEVLVDEAEFQLKLDEVNVSEEPKTKKSGKKSKKGSEKSGKKSKEPELDLPDEGLPF